MNDYCFCLVDVKGFDKKKKKKTSDTCNTQTYLLLCHQFPIEMNYLYSFSPSFQADIGEDHLRFSTSSSNSDDDEDIAHEAWYAGEVYLCNQS